MNTIPITNSQTEQTMIVSKETQTYIESLILLYDMYDKYSESIERDYTESSFEETMTEFHKHYDELRDVLLDAIANSFLLILFIISGSLYSL